MIHARTGFAGVRHAGLVAFGVVGAVLWWQPSRADAFVSSADRTEVACSMHALSKRMDRPRDAAVERRAPVENRPDSVLDVVGRVVYPDGSPASGATVVAGRGRPVTAGVDGDFKASLLEMPDDGMIEVRAFGRIDGERFRARIDFSLGASPAACEDCNSNGIPDTWEVLLMPDLDSNGDGEIDACICPGDLDGDGFVGGSDLTSLFQAWASRGRLIWTATAWSTVATWGSC